MSRTAIHTECACYADDGSVAISLHGMTGAGGSIAVKFFDPAHVCGLSMGFHLSTDETRELAAQLIRHADVTDARQAKGEAA